MDTHDETRFRRSDAERRGAAESAPDSGTTRALAAASAGFSRRSFLGLAGFSVATAACSRPPARKALALMVPDQTVVPGRGYRIATTSTACGAGCGVLAHCRDGRPIKLEGNPEHPVSRGGLCAVCQASILSLYDGHRLRGPRLAGAASDWATVDAALVSRLDELARQGGVVRVLSGTLNGPSTLAALSAFVQRFTDGRHVMYDALSASALQDAQQELYGVRALPRYRLERARVIAGFEADFLGTWFSPVEHTAGWRDGRQPDADPPRWVRHWHFESRLSPTGALADERLRTAPSEVGPLLAALCLALSRRAGQSVPLAEPVLRPVLADATARLADELWSARGECLVLCGRNGLAEQKLAALANHLLGNEGRTLDLAAPSLQRRGDDRALAALREELLGGRVDLLLVHGCNPAYDLPGFGEALAAAGTLVSTAPLPDETSLLAGFECPEPHDLERWDDAEPVAGVFALQQPTLPALRDTRTLRASLARWAGDPRDDHELLVDHWRRELHPRAADGRSFDDFLYGTQQTGFAELPSDHAAAPGALRMAAVSDPAPTTALPAGRLALVLHARVGLLDGRGAHNPWLQELPDPITKTTWGNEACLSPDTAARLGIADGDVVELGTEDGTSIVLPALVQPGQHDDVLAVALGQGRLGTDRFAGVGPDWLEGRPTVEAGETVGVNVAPLLSLGAEGLVFDGRPVDVRLTGLRDPLACTQDHHRLEVPEHLAPRGGEVRDAVRELSLVALAGGAHAGEAGHGSEHDLWPDDHANDGPRWGLAIDLAACTGCSACVVSCQAENNVPVVGRDEVRRHREMSWLRIDRYYRGDGDALRVAHQPMLCQHCGHAPCETVCPVLATVHSAEGLNAQVYNRCVGTRYCANNCPYKVRRFNWFEYAREDRLQNMVLNPDVTVRSRGVMEKCSMCVQRIQVGKAAARREGRPLADGEIQTACQQSCPSRAIVFGDLSDPASAVSRAMTGPRAYTVLGELNTRPGVGYLARVTSDDPGAEGV